jgi:hypothetical protein
MSIVLMAVGLLVAAAGFVTVGFGIPINAFSLGNTLIISGTIAVTSGLILIALGVVIGHLRRVAEALKGPSKRAAGWSETQPASAVAPAAEPVVVPAPSRLDPAAAPQETPTVEPRSPATASDAPGPLDWLRAKSKRAGGTPTVSVEPPVVEIPDEAPLSPKPPQRSAMPPAIEPAPEPKLWSPGRPGGPLEPRVAPAVPRATPQVEPQKERERFDLVWPDRAAPSPSFPSPAPQPSESVRREPAPEMPLPPIPARPRDIRPSERRAEPFAPKPAAERGPAILKSGVIDGMPYTLYADGSIEADLPTGTVKFASVDALRAHLEKQS